MSKGRIVRIRGRKRRSNSSLKLVVWATLCIAAVAFLQSGYFNISYIQIEGITETSALKRDELINSGGVKVGSNIFSFSPSHAENSIVNSLPWVKKVQAKRVLPNTIKLTITERAPFAYIYSNGAYYITDEKGFVMASSRQIGPPSSISVSGLSNLSISVGTSFNFRQSAKTQTVGSVLEFLYLNQLAPLVSEIMAEDNAYYIYTNNNNYIKFLLHEDFIGNEDFLLDYLTEQAKPNIMVELINGSDPIFKAVNAQ